jgi:hypothetical protein
MLLTERSSYLNPREKIVTLLSSPKDERSLRSGNLESGISMACLLNLVSLSSSSKLLWGVRSSRIYWSEARLFAHETPGL